MESPKVQSRLAIGQVRESQILHRERPWKLGRKKSTKNAEAETVDAKAFHPKTSRAGLVPVTGRQWRTTKTAN